MSDDPTQPTIRPTTGLAWGITTHPGRVREQNEDNGHASRWLFVVADGMGGHEAGEVASEITVNTIRNACTPAPIGDDPDRVIHPHLSDLVASVVDANTAIFRAALDNPDQQGMGTTVTALALIVDDTDPDTPHALGLVNVGDSRTYVMRHGRLRQVSKDHSFVQDLVDQGQITRDEARYHPRRNIVTRALGIEPDVRVDSARLPLIRGDRYLLCSDGLVDEVHDDDIAEILIANPDPQAAADALVAAANENGGRDNTTVIVVDVDMGDDPPEATEEYDLDAIFRADEITGEFDAIAVDPDPDLTPDSAPRPFAAPTTPRRAIDRRRIRRWAAAIASAAVVIVILAVASAWVRSSYTVRFTDSGTVMIYRGRDVLWFNATEEAPGQFRRDELDNLSVGRVEENPSFATLDAAAQFVQTLTPTTTTTTTTVPTTTVPETTTTVEVPPTTSVVIIGDGAD